MKEPIATAESLYVSGMNNAAHIEYVTIVLKRAESTPTIAKKLSAELKELEKAVEAEDAAFKLSLKNLTTDKIRAADEKRVAIYSAIKKLIHSYKKIPEMSEFVILLEQALKDYDIKGAIQIDKKNGLMSNLIEDFKTKYLQAVRALGIENQVDQFDKANQETIDLIDNRTDQWKEHSKGELRAARLVTDKAYNHFINMLNAHILLEGDAGYADFVSYLNTTILHYQREVLHQRGKAKTADDDTSDGNNSDNNDGDEEEPPQG
jgi:hypothetical protein